MTATCLPHPVTQDNFNWAAACPVVPSLNTHTERCHSTHIFRGSEAPSTYPAGAGLAASQEAAACSQWQDKTACGPLHMGT